MTMSELRRQGASTTSSTSPEQAKKKEKEKKVYSAVDLPHTSFSLLEDLEGADLAAPKRQTSFNPDRAASIRASDMKYARAEHVFVASFPPFPPRTLVCSC